MKYPIGINRGIIGKPPASAGINQAAGWASEEFTVDELIDLVAVKGCAFSAQYREGYRKASNFQCAGVLAADIDDDMSIDVAVNHEWISRHASFLYTTASHTEDDPRFRLVFTLERPLADSKDYANALRGLALKVGGDTSVSDGARQFYGNPAAFVVPFNRILAASEVEDLISVGRVDRTRRKADLSGTVALTSAMWVGEDTLIHSKQNGLAPLGQLPPRTSVYCPFHNDRNPSAFVLVGRKGDKGVYCMSCRQAFWPRPQEDYDLDSFDRLIVERQTIENARAVLSRASEDPLQRYFPPRPTVARYSEKFLFPIQYRPGITLVKSPKGSGKTEALIALVRDIQRGQLADTHGPERPKNVLVIGHRRALLRQCARRLGVGYYLDKEIWGQRRKRRRGFSICLDSLFWIPDERSWDGKRKMPIWYDVVIIDESEQVFTHLLSDKIRERGATWQVFNALRTVLQKAKAVYALDADLGLLTAHALCAFRPDDWAENCHIIYNEGGSVEARGEAGKTISLFESEKQLLALLLDELRAGKRCFVTCNSRKDVHRIREAIESEISHPVKVRWVTSKNSQDERILKFLDNVVEEFPKIQVLICSPSLGTGVDITFPNDARIVDHVFGFFRSGINKHTDIDQQLARVRHPGKVSVWVQDRKMDLETDFDVIRHDLATSFAVPEAVEGYDDEGNVIYDENHAMLLIFAHATCQRRASMKRLKQHFVELKRRNGWRVVEVSKSQGAENGEWSQAGKVVRLKYLDAILSAPDLSDVEYQELRDRARWARPVEDERSPMEKAGGFLAVLGPVEGKPVPSADGSTPISAPNLTPMERYALEKAEIQRAISVPLTREILELHQKAPLTRAVPALRSILKYPSLLQQAWVLMQEYLTGKSELKFTSPEFLAAQILASAGLIDAEGRMDLEAPLTCESLKPFIAVCMAKRTLLEEVFKIVLRQDLEKNPIRQLNVFLRTFGLAAVEWGRSNKSGGSVREYRLSPARWELMCRLAGLNSKGQPEVAPIIEDQAA